MDAPAISAASLRQSLAAARPPLVIDVRKQSTFLDAPAMIRGGLRRDPLRVGDWARTLPRAASVVVYCVHGHEVSQGAAKSLQAAGITALELDDSVTDGLRKIYQERRDTLVPGLKKLGLEVESFVRGEECNDLMLLHQSFTSPAIQLHFGL